MMMKFYKPLLHLLIPHKGNDYKPYILRGIFVIALLSFGMLALGVSIGSSLFLKKTPLGQSISITSVIDQTNDLRREYNLDPLVRNSTLDYAAELKAKDMTDRGYFAHVRSDGTPPWYFFKEAGYNFSYAGENLAINFTDSTTLQEAWVASKAHKDNLLNYHFREIGFATVGGIHEGKPALFTVEMFGSPAILKPFPSEVAPPLTTLSETDSLVVVKNNAPLQETSPLLTSEGNPRPWYSALTLKSKLYASAIYKLLIALVLVSLLGMIFIESKKRHLSHVLYGVFLLCSMLLLLYLNQSITL